ncbi:MULTISPECIES: hypothetical protein [Bacillus]|uniref:Uncharacterized protein n=1 Tax=Bacillus glycinifermentans TaxID=1664069 RepID=A0ABU6H9G1_9BACI|nr:MULTISPECIES: hypothetical protein [Bacillus]MEC0341973.1 hypothetical protein [Bacillus sonorensis]MEC0457513.1 hypothetical protein [Bacillus sonorensis]MEC0487189.1 hypothetical protein [Bacillus glycinifermentans]MEC0530692.1 hypothetical protein [Bacillus sonorensis]UBF35304.1 hypothetical protein K9N56_24275 [Bacillus sp. PM8313]
MKKFNLNQYVYVKLNEKGKKIVENKPNSDRFREQGFEIESNGIDKIISD